MKKIYIFLVVSIIMQADNTWYLRENKNNDFYFVDRQNKIMIPPKKYKMIFTENFNNFAIVVNLESKVVAINKNEELLYEVFVYDNGPDYINDGLFRIVKNGKIGFANEEGEIVINPTYDFADFFVKGYSIVNLGGEKIYHGENWSWAGGKWGVIDKKGEIIIDIIYDSYEEALSKLK